MVSYNIFTSPSSLLFFSIGYHSSTTTAGISIFWYAPAFAIFAYFPKMVYLTKEKLFNCQGTDCQLLTACHLFGSGSPLLSLSPFYHLPNRLSTFFLYFICYKHIEIMLYIPSIYIIVCCPCMAYNFGVFVLPDYGKFRCKAFSAAQWDFIPIMAKTAYNANLGLWWLIAFLLSSLHLL